MVLTVFGAMFAPRPFDVAKEEMLLVTKPGGRIVMGNWIPGDLSQGHKSPNPRQKSPGEQRSPGPLASGWKP